MRNLSFALTTAQVRAQTKTVTRRRGTFYARVLKPGDLLCAVEKSQGIKKGGLVRLGTIRVVSVRVERLDRIFGVEDDANGLPALRFSEQQRECEREGFPGMHPLDFVAMFRKHMGGDQWQTVTRIEFEYVSEAPRG